MTARPTQHCASSSTTPSPAARTARPIRASQARWASLPPPSASLVASWAGRLAGRLPLIVGISSARPRHERRRSARDAHARGAAAFMVAAPADRKDAAAADRVLRRARRARARRALMLQNVPPPAGAGLTPERCSQILASGARHRVRQGGDAAERPAPDAGCASGRRRRCCGVFGGAGGRYVTDELRRGAAGTMPAIELAEVHVAADGRAPRRRRRARARALHPHAADAQRAGGVPLGADQVRAAQARAHRASRASAPPDPLLDAHGPGGRRCVPATDIADLLLPQGAADE